MKVLQFTRAQSLFELANRTPCSQADAFLFLIRLAEHFEVPVPSVAFRDQQRVGVYRAQNRLVLPTQDHGSACGKDLTIGLVLSVFAALLDYQRSGRQALRYKQAEVLREVVDYYSGNRDGRRGRVVALAKRPRLSCAGSHDCSESPIVGAVNEK